MIINYVKERIIDFISRPYASYSSHFKDENVYYRSDSYKTNGQLIIHPFKEKVEIKEVPETVIQRTGFLGLKKEAVEVMREHREQVLDMEGISYLTSCSTHIDGNLLMPKIIKNPVFIGEVLALVKVDPRFLYQINPSIVKKEEIQSICEAASEGLKSVLDEQSVLGVTYSDAEHQQRIEYMKTCADALQKFQARWLEMEGLKNLSGQKV